MLFLLKSLDHDRLSSNDFFMRISRKLSIHILKYCHKHPQFYFPFIVVCREYSPEDDDFVEIMPGEWKDIQRDKAYQTFELWENLQSLDKKTLYLMSKGFLDKINKNILKKKIQKEFLYYDNLYKIGLTKSEDIEEYGENEFFWWKREAFEDILEYMEKNGI